MTEEATRKAFEAWANVSMPHAPNFRRASSGEYTKQGDYSDWGIGYAWLAWQAATRAAAPAWLPIETAPKDHFPRLFQFDGAAVQCFVDACGNLTALNEWGQTRKVKRKPTGWMPPPAAPEDKP